MVVVMLWIWIMSSYDWSIVTGAQGAVRLLAVYIRVTRKAGRLGLGGVHTRDRIGSVGLERVESCYT